MAIQFHPLPAELFPASLQPYIKRHNVELREIFGLEGTIRQPLTSRKSDLSISRRGTVQVDVSRITPSIVNVVSGISTVVGTPGLILGTANLVGSTTTALSINSTVALFGSGLPAGLSSTASAGSSAFAARGDHVHLFGPTLRSTANASTMTLTDNGTDQALDFNLGNLDMNLSGLWTINLPNSATTGIVVNPGDTTNPSDTINVNIKPSNGGRTGIKTAFFTMGTLTGVTVTAWDARFASVGGVITSCTIVGFDTSQARISPTAGSSGGNIFYGIRTSTDIGSASGGWTTVAGALFEGPRRFISNPSVLLAAGIITEPAVIGSTQQIGLYVRQRTAQATAAKRMGIRIDAQNSGTARWSIQTSDRIENDTTDLHASASGKGLVVLASDDNTRWLRIRALYNGGAPSLTVDDIGTTQPSP